MTVQRISAIAHRVSVMARAVEFYSGVLGLELLYGGPGELKRQSDVAHDRRMDVCLPDA